MEKLTFIHTNDLHSHLENWPKIRRYLDSRRRELAKKGSVITVDLGDFVDRWHPLTEATNGRANIQLMNEAHYDVVTIGNNEGIGNAKEELNHLYDEANFKVLLANLHDPKTLSAPEWCRPYEILTTKAGTKVGLIAMTAPFPLTYGPNGWDIRQPMELLPAMVNRLRKQVDVLVLMSHLGLSADLRIAQDLPQLDVILGSHTHHLLPEGRVENGVLLAAAGKFGQHIGEVQLFLDEEHRVKAAQAYTIDTEELTTFAEDAEEIQGYLDKGHSLLHAQQVADLPFTLKQDLSSEHSLIRETLKAVKERGQTEAAVLNTGLFLTEIPAGVVDADQLHECLPHPMHLIRVTLKGADLYRLILEMEKNRFFLRQFPVYGMGFRGKIFGEIVYDGIDYDPVNRRVLWQGAELDFEQEYRLTTVDHFMFVPFFPTIEIMGQNEFLFPEFIRSVLGHYLETHYPM
ncbi:metallophosphoesterase [Enterococcus asini]|uniref:bifunctional metallophosphatase/5'-nucleotidase n=1 Tax=Enterococcus asini TaxID=57732 RepID=UPI00288CE480|nr:metallophosphoesterase [Enterococcus asini]MDT2757605.1 metallophosphoesterase [Enterococcus asini]